LLSNDGQTWNFVQVDSESGLYMKAQREPLVSYGNVKTAAFKKADAHPKNYGVPNFGVD